MNSERYDVPKNIRQVGYTISDKKIYVEDYVLTYIKQLYGENQRKILVLLGRMWQEQNNEYIFVNGVIEVSKDVVSFSQILENENISNIVKIKEDFYYNEDIVGIGIITIDEWECEQKDVIRSFRSGMIGSIFIAYDVNREEMIYRYNKEDLVRIKGYYIYYDRNESMQNYMLCMKDGKSIEYGYAKTEVPDNTIDDKIRMYTIPKNTVYSNRRIDLKRNKKCFDKKISKKIRYCSVVILIVIILGATLIKVDKIEKITKKKAQEMYCLTSSVAKIDKEEKNSLRENNKVNDNVENKLDNVDVDSEIEVEKEIEKVEENRENEVEKEVEKVEEDRENDGEKEVEKVEENRENDGEKKVEKTEDEIKIGEKIRKEKDNDKQYEFYIVKKGDVLVNISKKIYGTIKKVDNIKRMNGLKDEDRIYIGQRLILP